MPIGPMGYVHDWRATEEYLARSQTPCFAASGQRVQDSGVGKTVLLFDALTKLCGKFPIHNQTIGDCVSHGWGISVDVIAAIDVIQGRSEWRGESATEAGYALSRVEIGKGRLGGSDGSIGAWMADAVQQYGTLRRAKYPTVDLTTYSGARAKAWGMPRAGLPNELEPLAREHVVQTVSLVTSWEQVRDAIANGYPVAVCSSQGFSDKRDAEGFARPSGRWAHCMALLAVNDDPRRPSALCVNSWGPDWISGPTRLGQPPGSFWIDAPVINTMVSRDPDSYVMGGLVGYPVQTLDYLAI
jgi:hypothetical protein